MQRIPDSKTMAKALRRALADRKIALSHSDCLELVARQLGLADWNTLAARNPAASPADRKLVIPDGWFQTSNTDTRRYRLGLDASAPGIALIECIALSDGSNDIGADQFACMMQSVVADDYRGTRLRLTASISTEDAGLGTIWMRIDAASGQILRFDNLMQRTIDGPISGTTGWTERSIVLDVPPEAMSLHYGFFLKGFGRVRARAFRLETAAENARTTEIPRQVGTSHHLPRPANLDFSKSSPLDGRQ